ncbi:MAG TPA: amino acid permease [Pyrinomonadaceae bacterium]|jgi:APA family basic amino acid/polyamine antiporter
MQKQTITLVRGLGLLAAISIIIGNVIGTGVFLKARVMTCNVGSPTWVLIVWIAAGLLSLAGALTYAELAAMKPEAGGEYVFLRDAYGRISSFLYGWMLIFVGKTGAQASVAVVFAIGLNDFLDGKLKQTLFKTDIFGYSYELTSLQLIAVMLIIIFTTINCASVVLSGRIATALTFVKIALIAFVGIGAFIWVTGGTFSHFGMMEAAGACEGVNDAVRVGSASYTFIGGFGAAMLGALWGYDGWNNLSLVAGEIENPGKNIPLALIGGTIVIIILYVFVHFAYFYVLDPTTIASVSKDSSVAKEVVSRFFGGDMKTFATGFGVALFTVGLMLSSIGTLHTSILTGARVPYAMAKDGLMFESVGRLSEGTRVPVIALIFQGAWAILLALSGSFDTLTDYVIFGSWIFYALVTSSVFVFRKKMPDAIRPYKAFGYPVVPILFLLVAAYLLINTLITAPTQSFTGIFLILLGLPVYYYLTSKYKGRTEEINEDVNDR